MLVGELKAQAATELTRAARFKPRSGADVKREFAAGASSLTYQFETAAETLDSDGGNVVTSREVHETLANVPDDKAEYLYTIAMHYVAQAAGLLANFERCVTVQHKRYLDAVESEQACITDPGETQAMERALDLLLLSYQPFSDAFNCLVYTCELDILFVDELAFRLDRLITELELYGRAVPQAIGHAKLHLDKNMLDLGVVTFHEAALS